jgi:hypothetical protein
VQVKFWPGKSDGETPDDVMTLRRLGVAETEQLAAALEAARDGDRAELLFELSRGFSPLARGVARMAVGVGVVVGMGAAVVAFLAPSAAGVVLVFVGLPAVALASVAAGRGYTHDTGLRVFADGRVRREGWSGIRENNVRDHARVTLSERRRFW